MGNNKSSQEAPETQSIVGHNQQDYRTQNTGGSSGQHYYMREPKIFSNNLNRLIQQQDEDVFGVVKSEGKAGPSQGSDSRDLRIAFDRKDISAPIAVTIDSISKVLPILPYLKANIWTCIHDGCSSWLFNSIIQVLFHCLLQLVRTTGRRCRPSALLDRASTKTSTSIFLWSSRRLSGCCITCGCVCSVVFVGFV